MRPLLTYCYHLLTRISRAVQIELLKTCQVCGRLPYWYGTQNLAVPMHFKFDFFYKKQAVPIPEVFSCMTVSIESGIMMEHSLRKDQCMETKKYYLL